MNADPEHPVSTFLYTYSVSVDSRKHCTIVNIKRPAYKHCGPGCGG